MSHSLTSRSPDLLKLSEDGYNLEIRSGFLILKDVPYLNAKRELRRGALVSPLELAGEKTRKPADHTLYFKGESQGEFPSDREGQPLAKFNKVGENENLGHGIEVDCKLSCKPKAGYDDYYHKMTTYLSYIASPAQSLYPGANARTGQRQLTADAGPFLYTETASGRAGIGALTSLLENEVIAIIGTGGTGSYILDFAAKTPAKEIRLFDGDEFLQHNAFRAPGAPSLEELEEVPTKVDYLTSIYSKMRKGIKPHTEPLHEDNLHLLDGITFAFLSMDGGEAKKLIVEKLEALGVSFIDVGMGLELTDGSLGGMLRATTSTPEQRMHVHRYLSSAKGEENIYASNIQIAELNAFNAALAVIKWKKLRGFYRDLENEIHCLYTTDGNHIDNKGAQ
ncbi:MAG: hypothetical protein BGO12_09545 [Verrucomicrobia bacterium 61-8]|nr:ThiF family adenylyltransferase [Verrucomicrobiota bacterium]OJV02581.1 MAG: hypothetical protein BGO12_09545 [Verrucomicrobia bacterium 61-8]